MALERMTIAIASYQRRDPLVRLLSTLDQQLAASPELREGVEIVVVLDGSTDGSKEAVEAAAWSVPVHVRWQPNRGLAAARNVGLDAARGGIVWFLDDDLIPSDGLLERHRRGHVEGPPCVLVGPCRIPPDAPAPAALLRWWDAFYVDLADGGVIDRFDRFTTANASAPAALIAAAGGFDERFVAYGLEDYELAVRLLARGTPLLFDVDAVAWHPDVPSFAVMAARQRSVGSNAAQMARLHPEVVEQLFPWCEDSRPRRLLRRLRLRSPRSLMAMSRLAAALHAPASRVGEGAAARMENLAVAAGYAAGVAEGDPDGALLRRVLGQEDGVGGGRPWRRAERWRARASRQPASSPPSNGSTISR